MTWNVHGIYNEGKEVKCWKCGKGEMLYQHQSLTDKEAMEILDNII